MKPFDKNRGKRVNHHVKNILSCFSTTQIDLQLNYLDPYELYMVCFMIDRWGYNRSTIWFKINSSSFINKAINRKINT